MLINLKRYAKYMCDKCYMTWDKEINIFNMSNGKMTLKCPDPECGADCVLIEDTGTRYRLRMACPICETGHMTFVKKADFWNKRLITYKCPIPNMEIYYMGEEDAVEEAAKPIDVEPSEDDRDELADEYEEDKMILLADIVQNIEELMDWGTVSCVCRSGKVELEIADECAVLSCTGCGRRKVIEPNNENLMMLLQAEELILKD